MFRPNPEHGPFYFIPLRLIISVLIILALAVSVILMFSLEHERVVVQGLTSGHDIPTNLFPALWQSRRDLITIAVLLFLLSGTGIASIVTYQHYQGTRRTLEAVKGLARNVLHNLPTGIISTNRSGIITAVNPKAESIVGYPAARLLGSNYEDIFPEGDTIRSLLQDSLRHDTHIKEQDFVYQNRSTEHAVTIRISTVALTGDDGGTEGMILQIADVTDILSLERRLRNAEKLAALHTLSAGVAHEIRNPLSALDLNMHLLEEELQEQEALRGKISSYVEVVKIEVRRLQDILDNFLKFAKPSSVEMHEVRLKDLVDHIVQLFQHEIDEKGIKIETQAGWGVPKVLGDETQLSQVFVNIMVNAVQSMPRGGVIRIAVNTRWLDGDGWVEVLVQDTGVGIKRDDLRRLFEPFYSTKPNGSGLGLAIAYRIVEDHHGQLNVTSEEGRGTTVTVRLPVLEEVVL